MVLAMASLPPPAAVGTTMVSGFSDCATLKLQVIAKAKPATHATFNFIPNLSMFRVCFQSLRMVQEFHLLLNCNF
jgi:hypothetical protein